MANPVHNIISRALRGEKDRVNVICMPTHERYQSNMSNVNANFYMIHGTPGVKGNCWINSYAQMPKNHILLPSSNDPLQILPRDVSFHCIFSQHRFGQWQTAEQLARILHIPHVNLEHTWYTSNLPQDKKGEFKKMRADINIFISPQSREAWGWNEDEAEVILHGVNANLFKPLPHITKKTHVLSVVNDWINRGSILGFDIWQRVVQNNFPYIVRGDTKGLSTTPNNVMELVQNYNESTVFFNTSRESPVPSVMLEAMACGVPVVSTDNCLITDVIVDGYNGFKTNDENIMREKIAYLLGNPEEAARMGANARQTILDKFSLNAFTAKWDDVMYRAANMNFNFKREYV